MVLEKFLFDRSMGGLRKVHLRPKRFVNFSSRRRSASAIAVIGVFLSLVDCSAAFNANLKVPWARKVKRAPRDMWVTTKRRKLLLNIISITTLRNMNNNNNKNEDDSDPDIQKLSPEEYLSGKDYSNAERAEKKSVESASPSVEPSFGETSKLASKATEIVENIKEELSKRQLLAIFFKLTRPSNFPSIVFLHLLGIFLALPDSLPLSVFRTLSLDLRMQLVLLSVMLTSATSMIVNDYYDTKLGRDDAQHDDSPLVRGDVQLAQVKQFLSGLYAAALVCVAFLPGIPTRLSVLVGLMMTYWYTQHLKPITFVKNTVCAGLVALSPLTSGSAALHVLYDKASWNWQVLFVPRLWRLVGMLFWGMLGREIIMDCTDVEQDTRSNVQTIPVVYGSQRAAQIAAVCTTLSTMLAAFGPVRQVIGLGLSWTSGRRMLFATLGIWGQLRGSYRVLKTQGMDNEVTHNAIHSGLISVVLLLASFV